MLILTQKGPYLTLKSARLAGDFSAPLAGRPLYQCHSASASPCTVSGASRWSGGDLASAGSLPGQTMDGADGRLCSVTRTQKTGRGRTTGLITYALQKNQARKVLDSLLLSGS